MSRLADAFLWQSESCAALGSPFMGQLMRLCAERWPEKGAVAERARAWPGDLGPMAASLPLRIAGGLHALVLTGLSQRLAHVYPPNRADDEALWDEVARALEVHADFLLDWIESPPQTNEVRRAAALIPVAHLLAARFGLPLRLSEMGASAGLNLNFDQFHLATGTKTYGPDSAVHLAPDWTGPCPPPAALRIAERRGVDLNPLDPTAPEDALRLTAYLWPDQADRLARTRAAMALAPAKVDRDDAAAWLQNRLGHVAGQAHLIYTTIAWQYLPSETKAACRAALEAAGAKASDTHPLAFLTMEADDQTPGAALTLELWPGSTRQTLARVDFHGRWITWQGPVAL